MLKKIALLFLLLNQTGFGQQIDDETVKNLTNDLRSADVGGRMLEIGQKLIGLPYLTGSLEAPVEKLTCRLDGFDCYTFVETVLALARVSNTEDVSKDAFLSEMQYLRYRNGLIDGYASRIHYFFEWAKRAEENGLLKDLTPTLGTRHPKSINFMSTHRQYYPAFKTDNAVLADIKAMEAQVDKYPFYEIKKADFQKMKPAIKNGDIIAFTSTINGLDVNHEGLALWINGELFFMHASSELKKVAISNEPLSVYLDRIKKHAGLMVLRVNS